MADFYTKKEIDKNTIQFTITVPEEDFKKEYNKLLKEQLEDTDLKGFRKGKVPSDIVEPQLKNTLKIQAFEKVVPMLLTTIIQEEDLEPVAPPEYTDFPDFNKEEIVFTVNLTIMPDFKLGNLSKIKVKREEVKVEEKEIDEALENIKKNQETKEKELNDELAKEIAKTLKIEEVKDLKSMKSYIEEAIKKQKEHFSQHKIEDEALAEAIKISGIEIPEPAVKFEAEERERAFMADMQQKGVNVDDFLKSNNIDMSKMRELWIQDARQALETDVLLRLFKSEREIKVTDEELNEKIEEIKKGAPEGTDQTVFENEQWRDYIRRVEEKERAFQALIKEILGE